VKHYPEEKLLSDFSKNLLKWNCEEEKI
jgi:hypothetical protein